MLLVMAGMIKGQEALIEKKDEEENAFRLFFSSF